MMEPNLSDKITVSESRSIFVNDDKYDLCKKFSGFQWFLRLDFSVSGSPAGNKKPGNLGKYFLYFQGFRAIAYTRENGHKFPTSGN